MKEYNQVKKEEKENYTINFIIKKTRLPSLPNIGVKFAMVPLTITIAQTILKH